MSCTPSSPSLRLRRLLSAAGYSAILFGLSAPACLADATDDAPSPAAAPPAATQPVTAPTTGPTTAPEAIARWIEDLGATTFAARESASRSLWLAGAAAEPALRAAVQGDDPEVATRAREILEKFEMGINAQTPPEIVNLLRQYHQGTPQMKTAALDALAMRAARGIRVLLGLRRSERDPQLRAAILKSLVAHPREAAATLIAGGDFATAEEVLAAAAIDGGMPARDYAAFLAIHGGLDAQITTDKAQAPTAANRSRLVFLNRAAGNLGAARAAALENVELAQHGSDADKSVAESLLMNVLIEQQDWPELARRLQQRTDESKPVSDLGFLAAYYRLSGDAAAFEKTVGLIPGSFDRHPDTDWQCAQALFLNDRPDLATDLLMKHKNYGMAVDFLATRFKFKDALTLPDLAKAAGNKPEMILGLRARTVQTLRFVGQRDQARKELADVAAENRTRGDFEVWAELVEAARDLGDTASADKFLREGLAVAGPNDSVEYLMQRAGIRDAAHLARWWPLLRRQYNGEPVDHPTDVLLSLARGKLTGDDLENLTHEAETTAAKLPPVERDAAMQLFASTLAAGGRTQAAQQALQRTIALVPTIESLRLLGDMQAAEKKWSEAADSYKRAWDLDHTQAVPLYLHGWALRQAGNTQAADAAVQLADLLPLAVDGIRHSLYETMVKHGAAADAARERDLLLRLSGFLSWERSDVLRREGDAASGRGEYAEAASLWQRAFIDNFSPGTTFIQPWANVMIPALMHKTQAMALIRTGKIPEALREAAICMDDAPGDADAVIDIANELKAQKHEPEAEAFFLQATASYEALCTQYPESGPLHNLLAWAEARTGRKLDQALIHAHRAVELEPTNTASLDTLAEACFVSGKTQEAIDAMQRCLQLEPDDAHHHKQMDRFHAATRPTTKP